MSIHIPAGVPALRRVLALTAAEARSVSRDTAGLLVPVGLPLVLLVATGLTTAVRTTELVGDYTILDLFMVPSTLVMVVAFVALTNLPSFLTSYRRGKVLKGLEVTPIRPGTVLLAQTLVSLAQTALGVAVVLVAAFGFMGAHAPTAPGIVALVYLLGAAAMLAVGILIAAVAPTTNTAIAIGMAAFLGFGALGGMFGPTSEWPDPLRIAGEHTPFGATVVNLRQAWIGEPLDVTPLLALAGITLVGGALALRLYRWR